MLRAICLDLMDTVLVDPYRAALHAGTGIDPADLPPLMDRRAWPDFEAAAIDEVTFAARFFAEPQVGRTLDLAAFTRARREGYRWVSGMRELVEALGGVLDRWVASNYPVWIEELRAVFGLDERFEGVVASSHVGVRKPDPAFFVHLLEAVGHHPDACLFVDDRAANCDAARAAGMRAHVFTDAADLSARLRAEGVALPDLRPESRRAAGWGGAQVWQTARPRDDERGDMARHRVAVIGGDGIGPEVTAEAVKVLEAALAETGSTVATTPYDLGGRRYLATGEVLPDTVLTELRGHDAILLGAVGTPEVPPGVLERGLLLALRFAFDQYVNLRPVKLLPGVTSPIAGLTPERCDLVVVRENTEGPYAGAGGVLYRDTPAEVATQESLNTRYGVERVVRYAAERAAARSGRLTLCHKTNVLTYAGDLWQRTVDAVVAEYPGVEADYVHVDALCLYLVSRPERFDVVVTDNLFGDIVTDLGAAVQGGLGYAASGNLDPTRRAPSMFEPVHGSAPDIAGTGRASPIAAVLSAALCLDHLGEHRAAAAVEAAVARVVADLAAPDAGGCAYSTAQIGDRIAAALA